MKTSPVPELMPLVSVVGRPNAGKSTLFNRLTGTRQAIVDSDPGITRDRQEGLAEWRGRWFRLIDTGGIGMHDDLGFSAQIMEQAKAAVASSRVVVFLVDGRAGLSPMDTDIADFLRRSGADVIVAVNKVDTPAQAGAAAEFHALGLGDVVTLSAEQGPGIDTLLDAILSRLDDLGPGAPPEDLAVRVAVIGRPNVGKSSFVNRLLGSDRLIVSDVPGTTRDAIDVRVRIDDQEVVLVDTAGLRRKGSDAARVDHVARLQAQRAVERADVALVLIDGREGPSHQDAVIAGMAVTAGAGLIVLVNKWDLVEDQESAYPAAIAAVRDALKFAAWAPVMTVSVLTGERLHRVFAEVERVRANRTRRIPTSDLNVIMEEAMQRHQPPQAGRAKSFRVKYLSQVGVSPPTFVAFASGGKPHFTWRRYLENRLREALDLEGTPIVVHFRTGGKKRA